MVQSDKAMAKKDVDNDRVMWVRFLGFPCQAWCVEFFIKVANILGIYVCVDEETLARKYMDIARVLIRISLYFNLPECLSVSIDEEA